MTPYVDHIQRWAPTVTTLICVALALALWLPSGDDTALLNRNATPAVAEEGPEIEQVLAMGAEALLARPLFHVTRRPPAQAATAAPAAPAELTLSLMGILNSDDVQIALMRLSNSPELLRRRVGEQVGPWRVIEITQRAVTVQSEDGNLQALNLTSGRP